MNWFYISALVAICSVALSLPILSGNDPILTNCQGLHNNNISIDFTKYDGQWYELYHTNSFYFDHECVCSSVKLTLIQDDNIIRIDNSCHLNDELIEKVGKAKITGNASLRVSFGLPFYAQYEIVYIDPDYNFAAILSCSPVPILGGINLWILGRNRDSANQIDKIENIMSSLTDMGLKSSVEKLVKTNQTHCDSDILRQDETNINRLDIEKIYNNEYYVISQSVYTECECKKFRLNRNLTGTTLCYLDKTNTLDYNDELNFLNPNDMTVGMEYYQILSSTADSNNILILQNNNIYFLSTARVMSSSIYDEYVSIIEELGYNHLLQILETDC
jgi:lipocalin